MVAEKSVRYYQNYVQELHFSWEEEKKRHLKHRIRDPGAQGLHLLKAMKKRLESVELDCYLGHTLELLISVT